MTTIASGAGPFPKILKNENSWNLGRRALLCSGIVAFCVTYNWLYVHWLSLTWSYWGFKYREAPLTLTLAAWGMAVIPSLWMPIQLKRPSQIVLWMIYSVVYIPSIFGPLYMGLVPYPQIFELMAALFTGSAILSCTQLFPPLSIRLKPMNPFLFWTFLTVLLFCLDAWVLVSFRNLIRLVSFADVYRLRAESKEITSSGLVGYALLFLAITLNPIYMALGLKKKRVSIFMLGFGGQLLIYAATGLKSVLLSGAAVVFGYVLATRFRRHFGLLLAFAIPALFAALIMDVIMHRGAWTIMEEGLLFFTMGRVFAMPGMLTGDYQAFFTNHPLTHFAHAKPFNLFLTYPYKYPLGYEVGAFFNGAATVDSNSHFWAADGLASFGVAGVVIISVVAAVVLWMFDSATDHLDRVFTCAWVGYLGFQLTNLPLLTLLGSGGLTLALLVFYAMPAGTRGHSWRLF